MVRADKHEPIVRGRDWHVISNVTRKDCIRFCKDMRDDDRLEWVATTGEGTLDQMDRALQVPFSKHFMSWHDDGHPLFYWGTAPLGTVEEMNSYGKFSLMKQGIIWLAATCEGTKFAQTRPLEMFRVMQSHLKHLAEDYDTLTNVTDARNTTHHDWLAVLGFKFDEYLPGYGPFGLPFWRFSKTREDSPFAPR